jgi:hypothetical protein
MLEGGSSAELPNADNAIKATTPPLGTLVRLP